MPLIISSLTRWSRRLLLIILIIVSQYTHQKKILRRPARFSPDLKLVTRTYIQRWQQTTHSWRQFIVLVTLAMQNRPSLFIIVAWEDDFGLVSQKHLYGARFLLFDGAEYTSRHHRVTLLLRDKYDITVVVTSTIINPVNWYLLQRVVDCFGLFGFPPHCLLVVAINKVCGIGDQPSVHLLLFTHDRQIFLTFFYLVDFERDLERWIRITHHQVCMILSCRCGRLRLQRKVNRAFEFFLPRQHHTSHLIAIFIFFKPIFYIFEQSTWLIVQNVLELLNDTLFLALFVLDVFARGKAAIVKVVGHQIVVPAFIFLGRYLTFLSRHNL